jgi:hypothetical protein
MVEARITHMIEFLGAPTINNVQDEKQAEQFSAADQHEPHNLNPKSHHLPGGRLRRCAK